MIGIMKENSGWLRVFPFFSSFVQGFTLRSRSAGGPVMASAGEYLPGIIQEHPLISMSYRS